MSQPIDRLVSTLKNKGYSLTGPRKAIFQSMLNREPQSLAELSAACPSVDRATVYRTVVLFEHIGIIQRLQIGWKYKLELSDAFHSHHHHMTCNSCGKVISFEEDDRLLANLNSLAKSKGFKAQLHQLEIQGICKDCL